jgi:hypothetical protein
VFHVNFRLLTWVLKGLGKARWEVFVLKLRRVRGFSVFHGSCLEVKIHAVCKEAYSRQKSGSEKQVHNNKINPFFDRVSSPFFSFDTTEDVKSLRDKARFYQFFDVRGFM